jgi:hypothetical protein
MAPPRAVAQSRQLLSDRLARTREFLSHLREREDWDIQAFCTNCADEAYIAAIEGGTGNRMIYGNPRSAGVRFRKDF